MVGSVMSGEWGLMEWMFVIAMGVGFWIILEIVMGLLERIWHGSISAYWTYKARRKK